MFHYCETNKFRRKNVNHPLLSLTFFDTRYWWNPTGFPYKIFRHCETKNFRRKILILTPPPIIHKHFRYRKFCGTQHRGVGLRNNSVLWDKKIRRKKVNPPSLIPNIFRYLKLMIHQRIPLRMFLALRDKKFPKENLDLPHPLIHKLFRYRKFSKTQHRSVSLRKNRVFWDKKIRWRKVNPPSLKPNIFRYPKLMKH